MTEAMIVEAIRASGGTDAALSARQTTAVADPQAVDAFQAAMETEEVTPVPFATQVAEVWRTAQVNQQEGIRRMKALSELSHLGNTSLADLTRLQYEVANFSFQQEIVTSIAKKASDGISTLIKNQ